MAEKYICVVAAEWIWGCMGCHSEVVCYPEEYGDKIIYGIGNDEPEVYRLPSREAAKKFIENSWTLVCVGGEDKEKILKELGAERIK